MEHLGLWPLRSLWVLLPLTAGESLGDAMAGGRSSTRLAVAVMCWSVWAATLAASLVPLPSTLTAVRIVMPVSVVGVGWSLTRVDLEPLALVGLATALAVNIVAFLPDTGDRFVDGASYGNERRMALRAPGPLLLGPIEIAWVVAAGGTVAGPLLLAAGSWVAGVAACVVGFPLAALAVHSLHGLSRRWVVFVPAGMVLHDQVALVDPVLFPRNEIRSLGPAPADSSATDLTQGSPGLALEMVLASPVRVAPAGRRVDPALAQVEAVLFTPSLPGRLLDEAARRGLPMRR